MNPDTEFGVIFKGSFEEDGKFSVITLLPDNTPLISTTEVSRAISREYSYPR